MRFTKDRCLSCGLPTSERFKTIGDFWFCSEECYEREYAKHIPKEYGLDKCYQDGEEWQEDFGTGGDGVAWFRRLDEVKNAWNARQQRCIYSAEAELEARILGETKLQREEQEQKDRIIREKEEAKERAVREKEEEKERLVREKEKEKERLVREKEEAKAEQERLAAEAEMERLEPRDIPPEIRLEHTHILGPSGSGKTTLLQNQILNDYSGDEDEIDDDGLYPYNPNPPAYIVIDPKGLMVERLSKLYILRDRLVIIDPFDAPALNLFQATGRNPAQLISDFGYIFSTTNQKMTGKQAPCFSFCARLLFTLPHANLFTLLDLLDDRTNKKPPNPVFQQAITNLPASAKRFFENDFYAPNYASTREEIKARIWGVLENDTLSSMLNANTRKFDISKYIREKKIVLVNTRMTQLKEAHQTMGRYIIALTLDAIQSRTERDPVYLVIDEFQEFADPLKTPQMLRLLREYGGGAVLAHQNMFCNELDDDTRNAISTNTSIKYASSPEAKDSRYMAGDMRCTDEFLLAQHKSKTHARFACFVRGLHPPLQHPFIVESQFGWIDTWPKIGEIEYKIMRDANKRALQDPNPKEEAERKLEEEQIQAYYDQQDDDYVYEQWEQKYLRKYGCPPDETAIKQFEKMLAQVKLEESLAKTQTTPDPIHDEDDITPYLAPYVPKSKEKHEAAPMKPRVATPLPIRKQQESDPSKPAPWKRK